MITDAQANTLSELARRGYASPGATFMPRDVFGAHDNEDNGHRRTLHKLQDKGLLGKGYIPGEMKLTSITVAAYREWYRQRGFRLELRYEWARPVFID